MYTPTKEIEEESDKPSKDFELLDSESFTESEIEDIAQKPEGSQKSKAMKCMNFMNLKSIS